MDGPLLRVNFQGLARSVLLREGRKSRTLLTLVDAPTPGLRVKERTGNLFPELYLYQELCLVVVSLGHT
jgi:hypothetical protein